MMIRSEGRVAAALTCDVNLAASLVKEYMGNVLRRTWWPVGRLGRTHPYGNDY